MLPWRSVVQGRYAGLTRARLRRCLCGQRDQRASYAAGANRAHSARGLGQALSIDADGQNSRFFRAIGKHHERFEACWRCP